MSAKSRAPAAAPSLADQTAHRGELIAAIVPSLAAAVTFASALWLSAAALVSMCATALLAALLARRVPTAVGSILVLLAVAAIAGGADLAASAWLPGVRADLGIYLPLALVLTSGLVAAAVLGDTRPRARARRAALRALVTGLAFLGGTAATALAREVLGAGTITLPGAAEGRILGIPGLSAAPARAVLLPFAGLIAAGYLAGLVVSIAARRAAARSVPPSEDLEAHR